jgi:hypothetical protein
LVFARIRTNLFYGFPSLRESCVWPVKLRSFHPLLDLSLVYIHIYKLIFRSTITIFPSPLHLHRAEQPHLDPRSAVRYLCAHTYTLYIDVYTKWNTRGSVGWNRIHVSTTRSIRFVFSSFGCTRTTTITIKWIYFNPGNIGLLSQFPAMKYHRNRHFPNRQRHVHRLAILV